MLRTHVLVQGDDRGREVLVTVGCVEGDKKIFAENIVLAPKLNVQTYLL